MVVTTRRAASPARPPAQSPSRPKSAAAKASKVPSGDVIPAWINYYVAPVLMMTATPSLCLVLAYITHQRDPSISAFVAKAQEVGATALLSEIIASAKPSLNSMVVVLVFNYVALLIYWWPGPTKYGPLSEKGAKPDYADNGVAHCALFSATFLAGSKELGLGWYKLSVLYDDFPAMIGTLMLAGLSFCLFLYFKGLHAPSGPDAGTSGHGFLFDYYWGTELYPRLCGVDVKKFVNCRFSMTFWQLAGISFVAASYQKHGTLDPGLVLCALSQYLYLVKFYIWEIGYMRSIDIIQDRAGFYETWGCIVWVPSVYTLHTRTMVPLQSGLGWPSAAAIFAVGLLGVGLNFAADRERQVFRESDGKCKVWGKDPVYIEARYSVISPKTGKSEPHTSLLLASGWWGVARHLQYTFELTAAWSWGLLAGVSTHGVLPLFYPVFLTILLVHRAARDEVKCLAKYGDDYKTYMQMVPYKILPYIY